jgi:hypothetical protein
MSAIRVEVTAEQLRGFSYRAAWATPIEAALEALTGQSVDIDGGGPAGPCVATIGTRDSAWAIVVDLPQAATDWLDYRWQGGTDSGAIAFEIEIPTWVTYLVCRSGRPL